MLNVGHSFCWLADKLWYVISFLFQKPSFNIWTLVHISLSQTYILWTYIQDIWMKIENLIIIDLPAETFNQYPLLITIDQENIHHIVYIACGTVSKTTVQCIMGDVCSWVYSPWGLLTLDYLASCRRSSHCIFSPVFAGDSMRKQMNQHM